MDLRKTGLLLFLAAALLLAAPHILALTQLLYTYLAFPLKHTHVLGDADGFALHNLSHQAALLAAPSAAPYTTPLVPKIIHQVQLGNITMRPAWAAARAECARHHPAWDLRTWDDAAADAFVAAHYPHLFATYRGYPYEIQRTNILRYLLLHHYGGVYMDLDLKCLQPLDGLLGVPFLTPPANPTGVNNAFIVAAPGHAFLGFVVARVKKFDLRWGMPYVTNMFSTGCQFWSTMHILYPHREELAVLPQEYKLNGHVVTPLFEHLGASSWHKSDARLILLVGTLIESAKSSPLVLSFVFLLVAAGAVFLGLRRRRGWAGVAGVGGRAAAARSSALPMANLGSRGGGRGRRGTVVLVIEEDEEAGSSSSAGPSSPYSPYVDEEKGGVP